VLGERGAGTAELFGVERDVDLRMGTFSKSLASCGGFIAGPARVIDYLRFTARPFLFTVSAVPAAAGAALQAIRICRSQEGRQLFANVLSNARYLRDGLVELGYRVPPLTTMADGTTVVTPIIPVQAGDDMTTGMLWKALWDEGLYVNVALYPAVPPGQSLLRTSVMATHEREHLDRALEIFGRVRDRFPDIHDHDQPEGQVQCS
jgi:8-amino-7-oxononanoate synthase